MFVADAHCDTLYAVGIHNSAYEGCMASYDNLVSGGVGLQVFALFTGAHGTLGTPYADGIKMLSAAKDIRLKFITDALPEEPPVSPMGVFSVEGGEVFEGKLERLYEFDKLARIRMVALTWNHENEVGSPSRHGSTDGLKPFGLELLNEMDRLGIYADVSHLNDAGFFDICEHMKLPPIASHSNARELCDVSRNLSREQIKEIISRGGFIGINFYPRFLTKAETATIDDIIRHIDYIAEMGGIDVLGFGSDFDGIEVQPENVENASRFPLIIERLLKRGYTREQIEGIAGMNLWRLLKRAEEIRR